MFALRPGADFGKYRLRQELGRGGAGIVYLARDTNLERDVALKFIRPDFSTDKSHLKRFRQEAKIVASLDHANIVGIHAFDAIEDQYFIDMPYFAGGSVREVIRAGVTPTQLVPLLEDALEALICCHAENIVHRDIKPSNLLLDSNRSAKLSDFGISHLSAAAWEETLSGGQTSTFLTGTPQYIPIEVWDGERPAPPQDFYALGMLGREAILGELPIGGNTPLEFFRNLDRKTLTPLRNDAPEISPELGEFIDWLTQKDPADRPQHGRDALEALRSTPEYEQPVSTTQLTVPIRRKRHHPIRTARLEGWRRPSLAGFLVGAVAGALVLASALYLTGGGDGNGTQTRDVAAAAPPLQSQLVRSGVPDAGALLGATKVLPPENFHLYAAYPETNGEPTHISLAPVQGASNSWTVTMHDALGVCEMRLDEVEAGLYQGDGIWGWYEEDSGFRWGMVAATCRWTGDAQSPLMLRLDYTSQSDSASWSVEHGALPSDAFATDTALLHHLESTAAPATVFNELTPRAMRLLESPAMKTHTLNLASRFPALHGGRLSLAQFSDATGPALDGALSEYASASPVEAHPTAQHNRLYGGFDTSTVYLAFESRPAGDVTVELVTFYGRTPDEDVTISVILRTDGNRVSIVPTSDSANTTATWRAVSAQSDSATIVELAIPLASLGVAAPPMGSHFRLNAHIGTGDADGGSVARWGWPGAARYGVMLKFPDTDGPS